MTGIHAILEKYWGFKQFRSSQEDIINSVLQGNDTLALLPTGGGKSICFQVPALAKEGICIVISPLIALMKDQVDNLVSKGIKAIAITSTMHKREIDIALDNCVHGDIKFLYISPERLETELLKVRVQRMKVNLIAVDESHCISQWGYDFRPSYLKIDQLRELLPDVPVLALTATATTEVVIDIQEKLKFKKKNVIQKSFERKNLAYVVLNEEDKHARLLKIANNVHGTGIVYVRNRRKTQEYANFLKNNNISADFYHAGLDGLTRDQKQTDWIENKIRVIVCTNAFGMGIDKPDVRFVVHVDLPDTLEAYFQEAGRAGRDGQKSYAILLYNNADKIDLQHNVEMAFPTMEEIKNTYQSLANFYQIATGAGLGVTYSFDIAKFCDAFKLSSVKVFNCLKFIEREGYISNTEALHQPSRIKFEVNRDELYNFQIQNPAMDNFVKLVLRSYSGLFDGFIKINETELSQKGHTSREDVIKKIHYLQQNKVITFVPQTDLPQLTFTQERIDAKYLTLSKENFALLKQRAVQRMEAVIYYAESTHKCRSQILLAYFGETNTYRCNQCDICLEENKTTLHSDEFENIGLQIIQLLSVHPMPLKILVDSITDFSENKILKTIQLMTDHDQLAYNDENKLCLPE